MIALALYDDGTDQNGQELFFKKASRVVRVSHARAADLAVSRHKHTLCEARLDKHARSRPLDSIDRSVSMDSRLLC